MHGYKWPYRHPGALQARGQLLETIRLAVSQVRLDREREQVLGADGRAGLVPELYVNLSTNHKRAWCMVANILTISRA